MATPTRGKAGCSRPLLLLLLDGGEGVDAADDDVEVEAAPIVDSRDARGRGDQRWEQLLLVEVALIDDENRPVACAIRSAALPRAAQERSRDRMLERKKKKCSSESSEWFSFFPSLVLFH